MRVEKEKSCALVRLPSFVDMTNAGELKQVLGRLLEEGCSVLALDCDVLQRIDSAGLSCLLVTQKRLKEQGGELKLVNVGHPFVRQLFDRLSLQHVICIEENPLKLKCQEFNFMGLGGPGLLAQSRQVDRPVNMEMEGCMQATKLQQGSSGEAGNK